MIKVDKDIDPFFSPFTRVAETIVLQFGANCEAALHDLRKPQASLIAISGQLTKREIGAPITDYVLSLLHKHGDGVEDFYIYKSSTADGKELKSSTTFLRNSDGHVVGCLCINFCIDSFAKFARVAEDFCSIKEVPENRYEHYSRDIAEMVENILETVLRQKNYGILEMSRLEKLEIVKELELKGLFLVKGSIDMVAKKLDISKYTLYSYIEEIKKWAKIEREE